MSMLAAAARLVVTTNVYDTHLSLAMLNDKMIKEKLVLTSIWRGFVALSCVSLCLLALGDYQRRGSARAQGSPAESASFNYSVCDDHTMANCQSCLSTMVNVPSFQYCGTGWVCGTFSASAKQISFWGCTNSQVASNDCMDTGYVVYKCTGGNFYICLCAQYDPSTGFIDCLQGGCPNPFCNGPPQLQNVFYSVGQTCSTL